MTTRNLQILLILVLGPLGLYLTHNQFFHPWIWVLPLLGILAVCELPPLRLPSFLSSDFFAWLALLISGMMLASVTLTTLQNPTDPEGLTWLRFLGAAQVLVISGIYFFSSQKKITARRIGLILAWLLMGAYLLMLLQVSRFPVLDIFAFSGWNRHGLPVVFRNIDFSSFDIRLVFIACHLAGSLLLLYLTSPLKRTPFSAVAPFLLFLTAPFVIFYLERNWNDSPLVFLLLLALALWKKGQTLLFALVINVILILAPEFIALLPFLLVGLCLRNKKTSWLRAFFLSSLPALTFWIFYLSRGLETDSRLVPAQNPLGNWTMTDWVSRFLHITSSGFIPLAFFTGALFFILLILRRRPRALFSSSFFYSCLGFLSLAFLDHFWISLTFFYLSFAALETESVENSLENGFSLNWPLFIFIGSRLFLLFSWNLRFTDTIYYLRVADHIVDGSVPYLGFVFEYPPLSLIPILIPKLLTLLFHSGEHFLPYRGFHSFLYFGIDLMMMIFLNRLHHAKKIPLTGLILYILGGFLLGELLYDRLDLLVGLFFMMGSYYLSEKAFLRSSLFLLLGTFFKLVPVIGLPLVWLRMFFQKNFRSFARRDLAIFSSAFFLLTGLCFLLFGAGFLHFMDSHRDRGIQLESTWASAQYLLQEYGPQHFAKLRPVNIYGAYHIYEPVPWLLKIANLAPIAALLLLYVACLWKKARGSSLPWNKIFFLAVLLFIIFCKVLSPQYLIWLTCLFPLCGYRLGRSADWPFLALYTASLGLTATLFHDYMRLVKMDPLMWNILNSRNALLILLGIFVAVDIFKSQASASAQKPEA